MTWIEDDAPAGADFAVAVKDFMGEPMTAPAPDIASAITRLGAYVWCEARLFEITGQWVTSTADAAAKVLLGETAKVFAWHAEQWRERLPSLREVSRESLMLPPSSATVAFADSLASLDDPLVRLRGLSEVALPRLVSWYDGHAAVTNPVRDAPVVRTMRLVRADHEAAIAQIEQYLKKFPMTPDTFPNS